MLGRALHLAEAMCGRKDSGAYPLGRVRPLATPGIARLAGRGRAGTNAVEMEWIELTNFSFDFVTVIM